MKELHMVIWMVHRMVLTISDLASFPIHNFDPSSFLQDIPKYKVSSRTWTWDQENKKVMVSLKTICIAYR